MKKIISFNTAGKILLGSFTLLIILHILILLQIIPSSIVWGGQLDGSSSNLVTMEIIALSTTLLFITLTAARMNLIKLDKFKKVINISMWIIFAYMLLNTLGNLASGVTAEKLIFTPLTVVMAFCALRLAIEK
ncbi:MAG: hypothetical protein JEZ06_09120 [Anaerolineaceae bacterium]|nr:hypothetical protein [Anaerolineaceae bacterium]